MPCRLSCRSQTFRLLSEIVKNSKGENILNNLISLNKQWSPENEAEMQKNHRRIITVTSTAFNKTALINKDKWIICVCSFRAGWKCPCTSFPCSTEPSAEPSPRDECKRRSLNHEAVPASYLLYTLLWFVFLQFVETQFPLSSQFPLRSCSPGHFSNLFLQSWILFLIPSGMFHHWILSVLPLVLGIYGENRPHWII